MLFKRGFHYVAGTRAEYSVVCRMQVAFRDFWKANQYRLYGECGS